MLILFVLCISDTDIVVTQTILLFRILFGKFGLQESGDSVDMEMQAVVYEGAHCFGVYLGNVLFPLSIFIMIPTLFLFLTHVLVRECVKIKLLKLFVNKFIIPYYVILL